MSLVEVRPGRLAGVTGEKRLKGLEPSPGRSAVLANGRHFVPQLGLVPHHVRDLAAEPVASASDSMPTDTCPHGVGSTYV